MPSDVQEQMATAAKAQLEAQVAFWTALNSRALEGIIKLADLNMHVMKESLEQSVAATRQLMSARDPQEFLALISEQLRRPAVDKALAYARQVAEIGAAIRTDVVKAAPEQRTGGNVQAAKPAQSMGQTRPGGAENIFGFLQSAMDNATAGYAQILRSTKENTDALQANLTAATQPTANEMEKGSRSKK